MIGRRVRERRAQSSRAESGGRQLVEGPRVRQATYQGRGEVLPNRRRLRIPPLRLPAPANRGFRGNQRCASWRRTRRQIRMSRASKREAKPKRDCERTRSRPGGSWQEPEQPRVRPRRSTDSDEALTHRRARAEDRQWRCRLRERHCVEQWIPLRDSKIGAARSEEIGFRARG